MQAQKLRVLRRSADQYNRAHFSAYLKKQIQLQTPDYYIEVKETVPVREMISGQSHSQMVVLYRVK